MPTPANTAAPEALAAPRLTRGADGWRGILHEGFSVAATRELARAIGAELRRRFGGGTVLVAHDGRFYSREAAAAAAEALAAAGLTAAPAGALPTPLAAFALRDGRTLAAVVITASHNPFYWNGVKLKVAPGMPPGPELEAAIEARRGDGASDGRPRGGGIEPVCAEALIERYVEEVLSALDPRALAAAGLRVRVDGLHGVAGGRFAQVLEAAGCRVDALGTEADPLFGGGVPDPMRPASRHRLSTAPDLPAADVGFLTDGDGDRLGVLDGDGGFVPPHDVLALLLRVAHRRDPGPGAVATTVSTGSIVSRAARRLGRPALETRIGFKYIAPYLQCGEVLLGGGGVGDVGLRGHTCDRDPIFAALVLLDEMARTGRSLAEMRGELHDELGESHLREETMELPRLPETRLEEIGAAALRAAGWTATPDRPSFTDGVKFRLDDVAWLLLRNASTEKGLRIYAEASSPEAFTDLFDILARLLTEVEGPGRSTRQERANA